VTVPNFCKGCGNRLEGLEREVCSAKECLNFLCNTTAQMDPRKNVSREHLLKAMEQDIRVYEAVPDKDKDLGWLVKLENLTREVEAYPWDDCTLLAERHEALLREMLPLKKVVMTGKISDNRTISLPVRKAQTLYYADTDTIQDPTESEAGLHALLTKTLEERAKEVERTKEAIKGLTPGSYNIVGLNQPSASSTPSTIDRTIDSLSGDIAGSYGVPGKNMPEAAEWHKVGRVKCSICGVEVQGNYHLCRGRTASQKYATWTVTRETWLFGKPNRSESKLISIPAHATLLGTGRTEVHCGPNNGSGSLPTAEWLEVADDFGRPMGWIENVGLRRGPTIKICGEDEGDLPLTESEMYDLRTVLAQLNPGRTAYSLISAILRKRGMNLP